ncbi:hypothetical protein [Paraburkholderia sp. BCC1876]|uniref:hypothetical protein n=1 Tax=Paraburkholderia sp. BCC1876 TaxID=2676303 RepID=UPI001590A9D9|nr:hypothetical protein [Paraburkholderia sp. BCC1876]
MIKTTGTLIAAVAALTLSAGAYAQSNNTLATPSTTSPVAATTSGYGTPGAVNSESGTSAGSSNSNSSSNSAASLTNLPGSHNTLATPSTVSPAAQ